VISAAKNLHCYCSATAQVSRQTGSHMRLTTLQGGEHHITIPRHKSLRVGTLNGILTDVAEHLEIEREALVRALFEK